MKFNKMRKWMKGSQKRAEYLTKNKVIFELTKNIVGKIFEEFPEGIENITPYMIQTHKEILVSIMASIELTNIQEEFGGLVK